MQQLSKLWNQIVGRLPAPCPMWACLAIVLAVSSCSPKIPGPDKVVLSLQPLQELATTEYTVTKVVKATDAGTWYTIGERKILITCEATIKAGIDLGALEAGDISVSGKSISIRLPEPKILSVNLPPANIKVASEDLDFFRMPFSTAEKDALMQQAERQMWQAGKDLGILQQAKVNTQTVLNNFLLQLGFEYIELTYDKPTKTPLG
jgi:hypothetical protein